MKMKYEIIKMINEREILISMWNEIISISKQSIMKCTKCERKKSYIDRREIMAE